MVRRSQVTGQNRCIASPDSNSCPSENRGPCDAIPHANLKTQECRGTAGGTASARSQRRGRGCTARLRDRDLRTAVPQGQRDRRQGAAEQWGQPTVSGAWGTEGLVGLLSSRYLCSVPRLKTKFQKVECMPRQTAGQPSPPAHSPLPGAAGKAPWLEVSNPVQKAWERPCAGTS